MNRFLFTFLVFFAISVINAQNDDGIIINDIMWAKYNVGEKGKFVSDSKENGNLYKWKEARTACPADWRLPTAKEIEALVNLESECLNDGREFVNGSDKIFFSAAINSTSLKDVNSVVGKYWCGTPNGDYPKILNFSLNSDCNKPNSVICYYEDRNSVRCVKNDPNATPIATPVVAPKTTVSTKRATENYSLKGTEWFDNFIYGLKFDKENNLAVCNFFIRSYSYSYTFNGEYGQLKDTEKGTAYNFRKYSDNTGEHIIVYKFDSRDKEMYDVIFDLKK